MRVEQFAEYFNIAEAFAPVNLATAANDGDWVSLVNYQECHVVFWTAGGAAAEPATITMEQATSNAGAGGKALNFDVIYYKQAATNLQSTGAWTKATQSGANTYALGSGANGDKASLVVITIKSEQLDVPNGFKFMRGRVADVGSTSQLGMMLYLLGACRYDTPLGTSALA
jgi:hypothetical protein